MRVFSALLAVSPLYEQDAHRVVAPDRQCQILGRRLLKLEHDIDSAKWF